MLFRSQTHTLPINRDTGVSVSFSLYQTKSFFIAAGSTDRHAPEHQRRGRFCLLFLFMGKNLSSLRREARTDTLPNTKGAGVSAVFPFRRALLCILGDLAGGGGLGNAKLLCNCHGGPTAPVRVPDDLALVGVHAFCQRAALIRDRKSVV